MFSMEFRSTREMSKRSISFHVRLYKPFKGLSKYFDGKNKPAVKFCMKIEIVYIQSVYNIYK